VRETLLGVLLGVPLGVLLDGLLFDMPWTPERWKKR
jgi:F0F1-type ATP synthase assembly protein I